MTLRHISGWLMLVAFCLPAFAGQIKFESMKAGPRTYKNVTVLGYNATDLYFTHSMGISNVRLKQLEPELQKMFNYDEAAATAAEQQQIADNEEFNKQVAVSIETQAKTAKEAEWRHEMAYEESLSDPLSEKSMIGRPLPELKVERWIGDKPDPKGHFQLIILWAPWSHAAIKFLPEMNTLQAKFPADVVFIGVVSEAVQDPEKEAGIRTEFPTGIDSTGKFIEDLSVASLPQAVLADPKGIVRFLGHPAALNEKRLRDLITKFSK
jgi:hypothetical protein